MQPDSNHYESGWHMMYEDFSDLCRRVTRAMVGEVPQIILIESPNPDAMMHRLNDPVIVRPSGILLQRCGGGRRVIRKRLGSH